MHAIQHRIEIEANPQQLYTALTGQSGLSQWWTKAETSSKVGETAKFYFGPDGEHQVCMQIIELVPNKKIVWQCESGPWAGIGEFTFDIASIERGSVLRFSHSGWQQADDFFMHCNSKWGFFFTVSLKNYLETGTGSPHPNDPSI